MPIARETSIVHNASCSSSSARVSNHPCSAMPHPRSATEREKWVMLIPRPRSPMSTNFCGVGTTFHPAVCPDSACRPMSCGGEALRDRRREEEEEEEDGRSHPEGGRHDARPAHFGQSTYTSRVHASLDLFPPRITSGPRSAQRPRGVANERGQP
jgi:hypothetical protein